MAEGLNSIKQQLREAQNAARDLGAEIAHLSSSTDSIDIARVAQLEKEFKSAVETSALLRDSINDTNEQISVLTAGSPFEKLGNSIGDVGSKLLSLDFEGARESSERLVMMSRQINFSSAIQGVKDMGTTLFNLGKALLTNPFFLMVGTLVAIGVAIYKLMDEIGLLKVITEALGKVFEWIGGIIDKFILEPLKMMTDALGWTNNASAELAEQRAADAKKMADAQEASSTKIIDALDHEIAMIKASGDESNASFEKMQAAEKEKRKQLALTAKARADDARAAFASAVIKGELDEKEIEDLKTKADEQTRIYNNTIKANKVADVQADTDRKKRNETQAKEASTNAKNAQKTREDEAKQRLDAERRIQDLVIENMNEGAEKEIELNRVKYERLRQDTLSNTKLTLDEKNALITQYDIAELELAKQKEEERLAIDEEAKQKAKDEKVAFEDELALIEDEAYFKTLSKAEQEEQAVRDKYFRLIETAKQYGLDVTALEAEQDEALKAISDEAYLTELDTNAIRMADKLFALEEEKRIALENATLTLEERQKLEEEYSEKRKALIMAEIQAGTEGASQGLNAVQSLSDSIFSMKQDKLEKGSAAELASAKKQFEINKKLQIAGALIQGVQAVLAAYSSGSAIPIVGAVTGPLFAAIAAVSVVANVNKIKNSKFEGGASTPSVPSAGAGAAAISQATSPAGNLFGNNEGNNATSQQSAESPSNQTINVVATVSETEITNTQQRMDRYRKNSEL